MVVPPKKQTKIKPKKKSTTPQLPPIPTPSSSNNGNWPSIPPKKIKKRKKAKKKKNISRIDKFNDRRQTLALLDLAKHTVLSNSFRDAKMPGGPQVRYLFFLKKIIISKNLTCFFFSFLQPAYEEAKKQLEKDEWEAKITGIEKVVTVSRKAPEVRLIPERKGHNFEWLHFQ